VSSLVEKCRVGSSSGASATVRAALARCRLAGAAHPRAAKLRTRRVRHAQIQALLAERAARQPRRDRARAALSGHPLEGRRRPGLRKPGDGERSLSSADLAPSPEALGLQAGTTVAVPAQGQTLWRITTEATPGTADFLSMAALGDPNRGRAILTLGVSMFATRKQAEQIRDRFRRGQHVSAVSLLANRGFSIARTGGHQGITPFGDHPIRGSPDGLLAVTLPAPISFEHGVRARSHRSR
jgi:hypothetical protein